MAHRRVMTSRHSRSHRHCCNATNGSDVHHPAPLETNSAEFPLLGPSAEFASVGTRPMQTRASSFTAADQRVLIICARSSEELPPFSPPEQHGASRGLLADGLELQYHSEQVNGSNMILPGFPRRLNVSQNCAQHCSLPKRAQSVRCRRRARGCQGLSVCDEHDVGWCVIVRVFENRVSRSPLKMRSHIRNAFNKSVCSA